MLKEYGQCLRNYLSRSPKLLLAYEIVRNKYNMTYYFIYKTTNLVNGKFYIGKHKSSLLEDSYLGSGIAILGAVKKYGKQNFHREILLFGNTEDEIFKYEKEIIEPWLGNPMCYNLVPGGRGFDSVTAMLASAKSHNMGWYGFRSMTAEKQFAIASFGGKKGAAVNRDMRTGMFAWTTEDHSKWSLEANANRQWITDGNTEMRVKLNSKIPAGFYSGRSINGFKGRTGMNCWTNDIINVFSDNSPGPDFKAGMTKTTPTAKLPWWNNGIVNKRALVCPGHDFVSGRLSWTSNTVECPHCGKVGGETAMKRHHFDYCKRRIS